MTRAAARARGSKAERLVADWLASHGFPFADTKPALVIGGNVVVLPSGVTITVSADFTLDDPDV